MEVGSWSRLIAVDGLGCSVAVELHCSEIVADYLYRFPLDGSALSVAVECADDTPVVVAAAAAAGAHLGHLLDGRYHYFVSYSV